MLKLRTGFVFIALIVLLSGSSFTSERAVSINFNGKFGDKILLAGKNYLFSNQRDSVKIDVCRFYISKVELITGKAVVATCDYKLVDLFDTATTTLRFRTTSKSKITTLRFYLGIDSTTNSNGAGAGELDPTKGMYWAWQSGYINFKIEGTSNRSSDPRQGFEYHLGGYLPPNNGLQTITLTVKDDRVINVGVDVSEFLQSADMKTTPHVMSPSANAVKLSLHAARMFFIEP